MPMWGALNASRQHIAFFNHPLTHSLNECSANSVALGKELSNFPCKFSASFNRNFIQLQECYTDSSGFSGSCQNLYSFCPHRKNASPSSSVYNLLPLQLDHNQRIGLRDELKCVCCWGYRRRKSTRSFRRRSLENCL